MEDSDILIINTGKPEDVMKILEEFCEKNQEIYMFDELSKEDKRKRLWEAIFKRLGDPSSSSCHISCLNTVRVLSRDRTLLNETIEESWMTILLRLGGLYPIDSSDINLPSPNYEIITDSLKCMNNLLLNSSVVQSICSKNQCIKSVLRRLRTYKNTSIPHVVKIFDMKIFFLLSSFCSGMRPYIIEELHGLTYLIDTLALTLKEAGSVSDDEEAASLVPPILNLNIDQHELVCEVLKVVFNLTSWFEMNPDEEEEVHFQHLVPLLRQVLLCTAYEEQALDELQSHTINVLMTIPGKCYAELMPPALDPKQSSQYDGKDMQSLDIIIQFLQRRLETASTSGLEHLYPVLTVLIQGCLIERSMRKYLRGIVLPPLKDVLNRPEEGTELRNSLCRQLTSPITQIRDVAADFLFILCKENVSRMVKYTGYGNCAGLLANRGLMLGGKGDKGHYSSESEDSDTEEYKQTKAQINPIIGCFEPPHSNPMENMSEEQQEYEAMKLVQMMDKLTRGGVVQPCRIGEDGRPEPVQHVLQLQEDLNNRESTEDSD